jgi:glycosyltransferase involved in cell wall biosynthesis
MAMQSRPPDEFLILDDGSTDNSVEIISSFCARFPFLRLIRNRYNQGVIAASQRLFAEARSDYVFAAAADDIRLPGFFERAMQMAEQYPKAGLVFGVPKMIDSEGQPLLTGQARRWQQPLYASPIVFCASIWRLNVPANQHAQPPSTVVTPYWRSGGIDQNSSRGRILSRFVPSA